MDEKPTQEQIKELWEWCGVFPEKDYSEPPGYVVHYPDIDLNNLFKYAVPKLSYLFLDGFWNNDEGKFNYAATVGAPEGEYKKHDYYEDPALSLFWAILEVIHAKS